MNLSHQADQQLVNDVTWIPSIQPNGIWRVKTYIQGYTPSAWDLLADSDWGKVVVLAHECFAPLALGDVITHGDDAAEEELRQGITSFEHTVGTLTVHAHAWCGKKHTL